MLTDKCLLKPAKNSLSASHLQADNYFSCLWLRFDSDKKLFSMKQTIKTLLVILCLKTR